MQGRRNARLRPTANYQTLKSCHQCSRLRGFVSKQDVSRSGNVPNQSFTEGVAKQDFQPIQGISTLVIYAISNMCFPNSASFGSSAIVKVPEQVGAAKSHCARFSKVPRKRFRSKVPRNRFPSRSPRIGSPSKVPRQSSQRFPSKVPRKRFPSKVPKRGSQERFPSKVPMQDSQAGQGSEQPNRIAQGFQARFPGTGWQARFPGRGSQAGFGSQARVPRKWFPSKNFRKRFQSKFQRTVSQARFPGKFPSKVPKPSS